MRMLTDILDVMTDGFHKLGIRSQVKIFFILVHVTTQNVVTIYLYRLSTQFHPTNLKISPIANFCSIS